MGLGILSCRSEKKFLKTAIKWRQIESKREGSFERCTVSCGEGDIKTDTQRHMQPVPNPNVLLCNQLSVPQFPPLPS